MMENMTMSNVAMDALLNETLSSSVRGASSIIRVFILSILGIAFSVLVLGCILGFCLNCLIGEDRRSSHPQATMRSYSMSLEEDEPGYHPHATTRGMYSEHMVGRELRSDSGSAAGILCLALVLLVAFVAFVVGAVKLLVWLLHLCGAVQVPHRLVDLWDSISTWVTHAWHSIEMPVVLVLCISVALLTLLYCGLWVMGFANHGIVAGSYAAEWMSSIGNVVAGSFFSLLQVISMGGISVLAVLFYIVLLVAVVVGALEIFSWLDPSDAIHVRTWVVNSWDSASAWVLQAWNSFEIFGWWDSFVSWLRSLWQSITDHHKWKIYT